MKRSQVSLSNRFAFVAAVMVVSIALTAQSFFAKQERIALDLRLREKALFINNFYAFLIADSLQRKDDVTLEQVINRLEQDQEITSVTVVDGLDQIRYHADPQQIGTDDKDPLVQSVLQSGDGVVTPFQNAGGRALALVTPLKVHGQAKPVGAMRIEMTYLAIEKQIASSQTSFYFVILFLISISTSFIMWCVHIWIRLPIQILRRSLAAINPLMLEATLPETPDEFGQINTALNDLILRFKAEWQTQQTTTQQRAEMEKQWVEQLTQSFLSNARVIVADKDNRILSDSGNGAHPIPAGGAHLLDLITDTNFATLVTSAFQQEGHVMRGPVHFEETSYEAAVLSVPLHQSVLIKTLIALQAR